MSATATPLERRSYERLIGRLKTRRESLGISQVGLDERLGLTRGHINKLEHLSRRPTGWTLSCWVYALGGELAVDWDQSWRVSELRRQLQKWARQVLADRQWSAEEWGRRAGTSATNITRLLQPGTTVPTSDTVAKLARASGSEPRFLPLPPDQAVPLLEPDAVRTILAASKAEQAAIIRAACESGETVRLPWAPNPRSLAMRLQGDACTARGIFPGDLGVIDPLDLQPPPPGCLVVALVGDEADAFALHPPILVPASYNQSRTPIPIKSDDALLVGRLVAIHRYID